MVFDSGVRNFVVVREVCGGAEFSKGCEESILLNIQWNEVIASLLSRILKNLSTPCERVMPGTS